ncbi:MAG TPA: acyltransferase [Burkholderiaceae bacterium]|jgi:predicted LPLAT superfamily acyltransferase
MTTALPPQANKQGRHWYQINEAGFVFGMRLLFWICRIFGRWPFRIVLYPVVAWYMLTRKVAREASRDYLRRISAMGAQPPITPNMLTVMRHFAAFAETMLDKMLLWGGLFKMDNTVFYGEKEFSEDLDKRRGGIIISCHIGNLDLCRILSKRRAGLKISVMGHTKHAVAFNHLLAQLDPQSQVDILEVTEITPATAMMLSEKIGRGEYLVVSGDRIPISPNPRLTSAKFMGEDASLPVGPYILASLLQCPVYLLFSMCVGNSSEIHLERFRDLIQLPRAGRDQAIAVLAAEYASRLEYFCLRAPLQWFNFFDFWHRTTMEQSNATR